jgi:cell division protein FtsA
MGKKRWMMVAAVDIGTTKICSAIARIEGADLEILGFGQSPSMGLRRGTVVNLAETIDSIKASLDQAEKLSQTSVESAWVSIGGEFVRGMNRNGETDVRGKHSEVNEDDVQRAVAAARAINLPEDYEIIHVLTQGFYLDTQEGIVNPQGMTGRKLGVNLHLVINASAAIQNIVSAVNKAGVVVDGVVMQQLASGEAILTPDEKDLGTIVADIGGGTTDVAVYSQGSIWHSEVLPVGGNLITRDIAIGLRAALSDAEDLKCRYGSALPEEVPDEEVVEVHEVGTSRRRQISRRVVCQIIQARCDEIIEGIVSAVAQSGLNPQLFTGVVVTGGGAELRGILEKVRRRLCLPARIGYPINIVTQGHRLCKAPYCTVLGLLKYCGDMRDDGFHPKGSAHRPKGGPGKLLRWIVKKMM